MTKNQTTIKEKISFEGIGLHTGEKIRIELLPAASDSGIFFARQDLNHAPVIKADLTNVLSPEQFRRRTSVGIGDIHVYTIEHLMAAFHLLGVDNAQVNIWGREVPGMDGSAKVFVEEIKRRGLIEQDAPRQWLTVKDPIWVSDGPASIVMLPYDGARLAYLLKYDHPLINPGFLDISLDDLPVNNFYEARTFCLEDEAKELKDQGLGKGSNYENTVVMSASGLVKNALRFPDEFVKHKMLDLVGDLYLAGPIKGYVIAVKSGHRLNVRLLSQLAEYRSRAKKISQQTYLPVPDGVSLDINAIMRILPHRYPFLLVDRIISLQKGKKAVGIKNVTANEHFFQGHFPSRPLMPGVLMIEAMAQVSGVIVLACEEYRGKLAYLMSADRVKFRRTVEPGDQLRIEAEVVKLRSKTGVMAAKAYVGDKLAVEAQLMFVLSE